MKKSVLLGIAIVAVVLFALPALGGSIKVEKPWPCTPTPLKVYSIPIWFDMPYFVKIREEPLKIDLVQINGTYDFEGTAVDKDGNVPKIKANFDATIHCHIVRTTDGTALEGDSGHWTCTITPTTLDKMVEYDLNVYVKVASVNLNAWQVCENRKVADCDIYIVPR